MPSNHLTLCHPRLLLPSIFPSIRVFSNELVPHIRWPKYWSFSFSISPSNEYSGLISSRMDWLDLPAVQGTLKSLLQHHSSKASILWCSAFFIVQLSHPYMTTGKTIALTRWTFVGKVMSLLFKILFKEPACQCRRCQFHPLSKMIPRKWQGNGNPLQCSWKARRSNQSIPEEISPEYSLETLMLILKFQYFGHLMRRADSLEKTLTLGKVEGGRRRG